MRTRRSAPRRALLAGLAGAAALLMVSSAAFACTVWVGTMTVQGTSSRSGVASTGTVTVHGANGTGAGGMTYCNNALPDGEAKVAHTATGDAAITVTVAPSSCQGGDSSRGLIGPVGQVNYLPNGSYDCMNPGGIPIGTMGLQNGVGSGTYLIPGVGNTNGGVSGTGQAGTAAICVVSPGTPLNIQAPITII